VVSALAVSGCTTTTGGGGTEVFCGAAQPIAWSRSDSADTIRAVKAHNAVGAAVCGWTPDRGRTLQGAGFVPPLSRILTLPMPVQD